MTEARQESSGEPTSPQPVVLFAVTDPMSTRFLLGQLRHLGSRGIRCVVVAGPGPQLDEVRAEGAVVEAVSMRREPALWQDLLALVRLVGVLRRHRPGLVDASTPKAALLVMFAAGLCRVPVRVHHVRGFRYQTAAGLRRRGLLGLERLSARLAHHVLVDSASLRDEAAKDRVARQDKLVLLGHGSSNGVDTSRFRPRPGARSAMRARYAMDDRAPVIGFVGRLVRDKGIRDLVSVFDHACRELPACRLLLVGDLEDGDPVDDETRQRLATDARIVVTGFVGDPEVHYAAMDVLVFPSYREGLPNVPLEAQSSELPVVAYAATGTVDAVEDGVGGRLVPIGDETRLSDAVLAYLCDSALREAAGKHGRIWVSERFGQRALWDRVANQYLDWMAG